MVAGIMVLLALLAALLVAWQWATGVTPYSSAAATAALQRTALATSTIHLITGGTSVTPADTVATLTAREATYDGYVPVSITAWGAPYEGADGSAHIDAGLVQFFYGPVGSPPVLNVVTGWYVLLSGGTLAYASMFDAPISMSKVGDAANFVPTVPFGGPGNPPLTTPIP